MILRFSSALATTNLWPLSHWGEAQGSVRFMIMCSLRLSPLHFALSLVWTSSCIHSYARAVAGWGCPSAPCHAPINHLARRHEEDWISFSSPVGAVRFAKLWKGRLLTPRTTQLFKMSDCRCHSESWLCLRAEPTSTLSVQPPVKLLRVDK